MYPFQNCILAHLWAGFSAGFLSLLNWGPEPQVNFLQNNRIYFLLGSQVWGGGGNWQSLRSRAGSNGRPARVTPVSISPMYAALDFGVILEHCVVAPNNEATRKDAENTRALFSYS